MGHYPISNFRVHTICLHRILIVAMAAVLVNEEESYAANFCSVMSCCTSFIDITSTHVLPTEPTRLWAEDY